MGKQRVQRLMQTHGKRKFRVTTTEIAA